jgi:hypothetical protein
MDILRAFETKNGKELKLILDQEKELPLQDNTEEVAFTQSKEDLNSSTTTPTKRRKTYKEDSNE